MFILNCAVTLLVLAIVGSAKSQNIKYQCGLKGSPQGLVVNGTPLVKNQLPWLVSLVYIPTNKHFCGGSIVSESHIITAAHCIQDKRSNKARQTSEVVALLGKHDLSVLYEKGSGTFYPTVINIHPDWNPNSQKFDADLAILFSEVPIQFSISISPICVSCDNTIDNIKEGTVSGWGVAGLTGVLSAETIPREVKVKSSSLARCYEKNPALVMISSFRMFCAEGVMSNSGPCMGDSGGGFYVQHNNLWFIRGIVSSSLLNNGFCDVTANALYTKLCSFNGWIDSIISIPKSIVDTYSNLECNLVSRNFLLQPSAGAMFSCEAKGLTVSQPGVNLLLNGFTSNSNVKYLHVQNQNTVHFPNNVGNIFNCLTYVLNEDSGLRFLEKRNFENMNDVVEMSLAHNQIESIPQDAFDHLSSLQRIHLHYNNLKRFATNTFSKNLNLKEIFVYRNMFEELQHGLFSKNQQLNGLHFDFNHLRSIKLSFDLSRPYSRLNFRDNDCIKKVFPDDMQLIDFINELKQRC